MNKRIKTTLQCIFVMLLWGLLFPLVKTSYTLFETDTEYVPNILLLAGIRFLICGVLLILFCFITKQRIYISGKVNAFHTLSVALFAVILHYAFTYTGLSIIGSGKTALLKQLGVLFYICFSFLFFKNEKFSYRKIIGAAICVCGIIVLNTDSLRFSLGSGEILIISASFCTVVANISSKKLVSKVSSTALAGVSQLIGGFVLTLTGILSRGKIGTVNIKGILIFAAIILCSCIGYCLWYEVVKKENLSNLFTIKFLEPIFAGIFSALIFGENIWKLSYLFALVLTFIAIIIVVSANPEKSRIKTCQVPRKTKRPELSDK